jgi:hypothetical protein
MIERENNGSMATDVQPNSTGLANGGQVDTGEGLCTDISARDEFVPWQERRAGGVRALGENLGNELSVMFRELKKLRDIIEKVQDDVADLKREQQNMRAAGQTVDNLYVRIIDIEKIVERVEENMVGTQDFDFDAMCTTDEVNDAVNDAIYDKDLVDKNDLTDAVMDALRNNVTLTVQVEEN